MIGFQIWICKLFCTASSYKEGHIVICHDLIFNGFPQFLSELWGRFSQNYHLCVLCIGERNIIIIIIRIMWHLSVEIGRTLLWLVTKYYVIKDLNLWNKLLCIWYWYIFLHILYCYHNRLRHWSLNACFFK